MNTPDYQKTIGNCHCGAITVILSEKPKWLVNCNCSICTRLGALWGHVEIESVEIQSASSTRVYIHGDRCIAFHSCDVCACTTHWEELNPKEFTRMGVNFNMCSAEVISRFRIRKRDGAASGKFLD